MKIDVKTISFFAVIVVIFVVLYTRALKRIELFNVGKGCAVNEKAQSATNIFSPTRTSDRDIVKTRSKNTEITNNALLVPTGMVFHPIVLSQSMKIVAPLLDVVSNATLVVNEIFQKKKYNIREFNGTVCFVSEDKENATRWAMFPYRTNPVICAIETTVFKDASLSQMDQARSFCASFDPDTGQILGFYWHDKHEMFDVEASGTYIYGYGIGRNMDVELRWNNNGELIHSNVWDLAKWRQTTQQYKKEHK